MTKIKERKLLYHITSIENLESILENGLLPRNSISSFVDIANQEIVHFRRENDLNDYVPFHFFSKNPFAGFVQSENPDKRFIFITILRTVAINNGFKIIPMHPIAMGKPVLYDYVSGFNKIDWDTMEIRDYHDDYCRHVCLAECLIDRRIPPESFYMIFVKTDEDKEYVINLSRKILGSYSYKIKKSENMFKGG